MAVGQPRWTLAMGQLRRRRPLALGKLWLRRALAMGKQWGSLAMGQPRVVMSGEPTKYDGPAAASGWPVDLRRDER